MVANGLSTSTQSLIPIFNGEKYEFWSIKMRTLFTSQELWDVFEHGITDEVLSDEEKKLNTPKPCSLFNKRYMSHSRIAVVETTTKAWKILKNEYQGSAKVITVKLQTYCRDFENLLMQNNESVQDYLSRVSTLVNKMKSYGEKITNEIIVAKILRSLTPNFEHVVAAIEESHDLSYFSFDELMSSLHAHEERLNRSHDKNEEKAFQVKVESSQKGKAENFSEKKQGRGDNYGGFHGRGRGRGRGRGQFGEYRQNKSSIWCHYCNKLGHKEADCWAKQKNANSQANFAEKADEDSKLFMAHFCNNVVSDDVWFLDSGCSNHMTGTRSLFKELDESQKSKVRLGRGVQKNTKAEPNR
ncbi:uncharacterized protein LOC116111015 [Pistacia vera]|uniref:uncharacterized protein LOC116111015 n=1 Tax=Pistacia vera TaxID=55513 RepID=UPI001263C038|nr:uncharacterized protein LOC116111015 [Pistacia vera]